MPTDKLNSHQDKIPYSMVSRDVTQTISNPDSLAIWTYIQSLPPEWNLSENQLREHFSIGKTRYMAAMRFLREMNLYEIQHKVDENNRFIGNIYHFYPFPNIGESPKVGKTALPKTVATENSTLYREKTPLKRTIKDKENNNNHPLITIPADIDKELWSEFMKSRRRLKASDSQTAIKILLTTLDKCVSAGFTRNEAISEAIERGWKSVKPEWLKGNGNRSFADQATEGRRANGQAWLDGHDKTINSTCERVQ